MFKRRRIAMERRKGERRKAFKTAYPEECFCGARMSGITCKSCGANYGRVIKKKKRNMKGKFYEEVR